ncbi:sarcosine oxidase subunit delta [Thetidibacter halocola]|uniref:Sarcosine oxidase subunit delta n=1 Tax=Thetidibacter halocola TaxID=2827239 RepID=A0A8J8B8Z7_9RHOB|nr:sarcosine oxidase subunit delta [Thetidibacter halocola]MBS0125314.1 sarcosine oxidase subunit delta [Thetidibacter halocola]
MRIDCPLCGARDRREFSVLGDAAMAVRPEVGADTQTWSDWLHLRDNTAGRLRELWYHEGGCAAWLVVERDTVSHAVHGVSLVGASDAD